MIITFIKQGTIAPSALLQLCKKKKTLTPFVLQVELSSKEEDLQKCLTSCGNVFVNG